MILIRKLTARAESFPSRCGSTNTGEGRALYPAVCCAVRLLSVENSGPSGSGRGRSCPSPRTMAARAPPGSTCCPCPSQFAPKAVQTRPLCRSKFCFQRAGNVTPAGRGKRSRAEAPAERAGGALAPPDRPARCWPARVRASRVTGRSLSSTRCCSRIQSGLAAPSRASFSTRTTGGPGSRRPRSRTVGGGTGRSRTR